MEAEVLQGGLLATTVCSAEGSGMVPVVGGEGDGAAEPLVHLPDL
jgi:hypothetical protein